MTKNNYLEGEEPAFKVIQLKYIQIHLKLNKILIKHII